ncbi:WD40 repeat domain-containing protein [Streptomyces sp. NPDC001717]|uniref:WD40 repeat domain-containing protein n=1 Tax=Streptomyces sp. NPDC001717 TaxID=3364604 RepID=UPI00367F0E04
MFQAFCACCIAAREHKVGKVRLLADGRYALSGGSDGTVRVWDVVTGRFLRVLKGHRRPVHSLAVTPDGR